MRDIGTSQHQLKIFYCYARKDQAYRDKLDMHLSGIKRTLSIGTFDALDLYIHNKEQGSERELARSSGSANIILLLVSPDFLDSNYPQSFLTNENRERLTYEGGSVIIPILLRRCEWPDTFPAYTFVLPLSLVPVEACLDEEDAFADIAKNLRDIATNLLINQWRTKADRLYQQKHYEQTLLVYEQILRLDPNNLTSYICKGNVLLDLERYNEAIEAYEQASECRLVLKHAPITSKDPLREMLLHEEALQIYDQLHQYYPSHFPPPITSERLLEHIPGEILNEKMMVYINDAIQNSPNNPFLYHIKGNIYFQQRRYIDAIGQYERAIQLKPDLEISRMYFSEAIEYISQETYHALDTLAREERKKANHIRDSRLHDYASDFYDGWPDSGDFPDR